MLIKKETEYAILGLLTLAQRPASESCDITMLAKESKVSPSLLAKVFQRLTRAGLVDSKFGPGGGFQLKKLPQDISLQEVIEAVQGQAQILNCFEGRAGYCQKEDCPLKAVLNEAENRIRVVFNETSLSTLIS